MNRTNKNTRSNICASERGFVLLVVVIFTFVLFSIASAYVAKAMYEFKASVDEIRRMQATEVARAGVPLGCELLARGTMLSDEGYRFVLPTGEVKIRVRRLSDQDRWHLYCTGCVPDATNPVVTSMITALVGPQVVEDITAPQRYELLGYFEGKNVVWEKEQME